MSDRLMYDDYGHEVDTVKVIPLAGGENILTGYRGFMKEMLWRSERNKDLEKSAQFPILNWDDLEVYFENGEVIA